MLLISPAAFVKDWPIHTHDIHELVICLGGEGRFGAYGMERPLVAGETFLVEANVPHYFDVKKGEKAEAVVICFDQRMIDRHMAPALTGLATKIFSNGASSAIFDESDKQENVATALQLLRFREKESQYCYDIVGSLLSVLLLKHGKSIDLFQRTQRDDQYEKIQRSLCWIEANLSRRLSIESAADEVGMSRAAFTKHFRAITGKTLVEYVTSERIALSVKLLSESDDNVTDVAYRCGYRNLGHFFKQFQRVYNMTPKQYRAVLKAQGYF